MQTPFVGGGYATGRPEPLPITTSGTEFALQTHVAGSVPGRGHHPQRAHHVTTPDWLGVGQGLLGVRQNLDAGCGTANVLECTDMVGVSVGDHQVGYVRPGAPPTRKAPRPGPARSGPYPCRQGPGRFHAARGTGAPQTAPVQVPARRLGIRCSMGMAMTPASMLGNVLRHQRQGQCCGPGMRLHSEARSLRCSSFMSLSPPSRSGLDPGGMVPAPPGQGAP